MKHVMDETPQQHPGVIKTLSAGFDITTHHIWLLILPIALDIFLWLGPRLSIQYLVEESAKELGSEPAFAELVTQVVDLASQVNVFTSLSIPLIGIPALMSGAIPERTPLSPSVLEVNETLLWFALFVGISLIGLLLTSCYLSLITLALMDQKELGLARFSKRLIKSTFRLIALVIVFIVALLIVWLPLLPFAIILGLIASSLFMVVMLFGFIVVAAYLSLSVPGIFYRGRPVIEAIRDSIRLVHRNTMSTVNLLLLVILIGSLTNLLWHLADDGSWLTLVSIAGHAFINTALVTAIFIYYRDQSTLKLLDST